MLPLLLCFFRTAFSACFFRFCFFGLLFCTRFFSLLFWFHFFRTAFSYSLFQPTFSVLFRTAFSYSLFQLAFSVPLFRIATMLNLKIISFNGVKISSLKGFRPSNYWDIISRKFPNFFDIFKPTKMKLFPFFYSVLTRAQSFVFSMWDKTSLPLCNLCLQCVIK